MNKDKPHPRVVEARFEQAVAHYTEFCKCLGIDISQEDTKDTPRRVAKLFQREFLAGLGDMPFSFTVFPVPSEKPNLVTVPGIRFVSICAHHHLPIIGYAHVCYLPDKKLAGLSKLPRLIEWIASAPSVQEVFTQKIIDALVELLSPRFAAVNLIAAHECMACRGVMSYDARMITEAHYAENNQIELYGKTLDEFQRHISQWYAAKRVL